MLNKEWTTKFPTEPLTKQKRRAAKHLHRILRHSFAFHHFCFQRVAVYPGESYGWLKARAMFVFGKWNADKAQSWYEEQAGLADARYCERYGL